MRPRRFSARSTPRQASRRRQWADYQTSGAWLRRRDHWIASGAANTECPGCGDVLDPHHADVHHLAYPSIPGTEADADLVLLCRPCHNAVHASLDASRVWRTMPRREASWAILTALRARHAESFAAPPGGPSSTPPNQSAAATSLSLHAAPTTNEGNMT